MKTTTPKSCRKTTVTSKRTAKHSDEKSHRLLLGSNIEALCHHINVLKSEKYVHVMKCHKTAASVVCMPQLSNDFSISTSSQQIMHEYNTVNQLGRQVSAKFFFNICTIYR